MFERFTDRAQKVMALAHEDAQRFDHESIDTEHILLGLVKEGSGVAANVLKNMGVDLLKVRTEVEKAITPGPDLVTMGKLPQAPRAKKVLGYAIDEARNLNHNYVGTEHMLLGLARVGEGVASQVLTQSGVTLEAARQQVHDLLGSGTRGAEEQVASHQFLRLLWAALPGLSMAAQQAIRQTAGAVVSSIAQLVDRINEVQREYEQAIEAEDCDRATKLLDEQASLRGKAERLRESVTTGHLLLAMAAEPSCIAASALSELGVDREKLGQAVHRRIDQNPREFPAEARP